MSKLKTNGIYKNNIIKINQPLNNIYRLVKTNKYFIFNNITFYIYKELSNKEYYIKVKSYIESLKHKPNSKINTHNIIDTYGLLYPKVIYEYAEDKKPGDCKEFFITLKGCKQVIMNSYNNASKKKKEDIYNLFKEKIEELQIEELQQENTNIDNLFDIEKVFEVIETPEENNMQYITDKCNEIVNLLNILVDDVKKDKTTQQERINELEEQCNLLTNNNLMLKNKICHVSIPNSEKRNKFNNLITILINSLDPYTDTYVLNIMSSIIIEAEKEIMRQDSSVEHFIYDLNKYLGISVLYMQHKTYEKESLQRVALRIQKEKAINFCLSNKYRKVFLEKIKDAFDIPIVGDTGLLSMLIGLLNKKVSPIITENNEISIATNFVFKCIIAEKEDNN